MQVARELPCSSLTLYVNGLAKFLLKANDSTSDTRAINVVTFFLDSRGEPLSFRRLRMQTNYFSRLSLPQVPRLTEICEFRIVATASQFYC